MLYECKTESDSKTCLPNLMLNSCIPCPVFSSQKHLSLERCFRQDIEGCGDLKDLSQMSLWKLTVLLLVVGIRCLHSAQPQAVGGLGLQVLYWHQLSDYILSHWMANCSDVWRVSPLTQADILIIPPLPYSFELPSNAGDPVYSWTLPTPSSPVLPSFYLQQPFPLCASLSWKPALIFSILSSFP